MALTDTERLYTLALALCPQLERRSLNHLIHAFGSADAVWQSPEEEWLHYCRLRPQSVAALHHWRTTRQPQQLYEQLLQENIFPIVQGDEAYPDGLLQWGKDAPVVLFGKGDLQLLARAPMISVVGTRRASAYGLEAAKWVAATLGESDATVVSGMALGVDGTAHRAVLEVHGSTIAVLGCGVNLCYPPSHRELYEQLSRTGLILSEYPPNSPIAKHHFPERNRIIAGLGQALVIVQAGERSGALGTVDAALSLGRDVYVVPGPITSKLFRGSNQLLKEGAQVLLDPVDLLSDLHISAASRVAARPARWNTIYEALDTAQSVSTLAQILEMPLENVFAALMELELGSWIVRLPGGLYQRRQS